MPKNLSAEERVVFRLLRGEQNLRIEIFGPDEGGMYGAALLGRLELSFSTTPRPFFITTIEGCTDADDAQRSADYLIAEARRTEIPTLPESNRDWDQPATEPERPCFICGAPMSLLIPWEIAGVKGRACVRCFTTRPDPTDA